MFKELDIVILTEEIEFIPKDTKGTIVHIYTSDVYEVEFPLSTKTITVLSIQIKQSL